ncbi:hypothetical protein Tco_0627564 [Tanacetum coccineum]|uniref:Uncharacterized protein n=1 Tax=Tanacetum coccineum TaxID=301880 RepID=A0ABQ4WMV1_9ASTR
MAPRGRPTRTTGQGPVTTLPPLCHRQLPPPSHRHLLHHFEVTSGPKLHAMINDGVTAALAARLAVQVARECIYPDFLKCQPELSRATEGVVGTYRWFEKEGVCKGPSKSKKLLRRRFLSLLPELMETNPAYVDVWLITKRKLRTLPEQPNSASKQESKNREGPMPTEMLDISEGLSEIEDKTIGRRLMSKGKRLDDVPVVREFPEFFPRDLPGYSTPLDKWNLESILVTCAAPVDGHHID